MHNQFAHYAKGKGNKKKVLSVCNDNNVGMSAILTDLLILLEEDKVVEFFNYCAVFKSSAISQWLNAVGKLSFLFVSAVKECELACGVKSWHKEAFNFHDFESKLKHNVMYLTTRLLLRTFSEESGIGGLKEVLTRAANENLPAKETVEKLKNSYSFYDWQVIFYSDEVENYGHFVSAGLRSIYCGSKFFQRNLKVKKNAIIAWCIPHEFSLDIPKLNKSKEERANSAKAIFDQLHDKLIVDHNYLAVIRYNYGNNICWFRNIKSEGCYQFAYPDNYGGFSKINFDFCSFPTPFYHWCNERDYFVAFGAPNVRYIKEIKYEDFEDRAIQYPPCF
jgi:hypothetical protein